jgi:putative heme iron utilization protein
MARARTFTGTEARRLLRRARTATLATLNHEGGTPYGSLVNVATDIDGSPLILVSRLAWHTRNLEADGRASLLVAEPPAEGDALTGPRVTVIGHFVRASESRLKQRYLARHPEAAGYAEFGDFAIWRMAPEMAHAVAGFGRIETLPASEVFPPVPAIESIAESAVAHMNEDHRDWANTMAEGRLGAAPSDWRVAAIDPDGCDLIGGAGPLRLEFETPVFDATTLRKTLADLAKASKI